MSASVTIRPAVRTDIKFVVDTMVQNLKENSVYCKGIHPATMAALVDPIIATYTIVVATAAEDPDTILGFLVYRDANTVAFVYVREWARSKFDEKLGKRAGGGIARALLAHAGIARATNDPCICRQRLNGYHMVECPRNVPEISCAFLVTKLDGKKGEQFAALAERKGYRLRFRPFLGLDITARTQYPSPKEIAK